MKITKAKLKQIIKEELGKVLSEDFGGTGQVEVEWDFQMDDDDAWNALSYEEQREKAAIPQVIEIPEHIMTQYHNDKAEYRTEQAEQLITDWLSDEFGWTHHGWSWVDEGNRDDYDDDYGDDSFAYMSAGLGTDEDYGYYGDEY